MDRTYASLEQLNCILPIDHLIDGYDDRILNKRIAIVIHLHYLDTFDKYKQYINNIPQEIAVYFTTSNHELMKEIEFFIKDKKKWKLIQKENRGRDISSFLVACRKEILNHDYICFIHDKKEKSALIKADIDKWVYSQWENILGSKVYICNILTYFQKNLQIGMLLPPLPFSERISIAFMNNWSKNYENTIRLAKCLNLDCNINKEISPMALGTVYWARVDALRKLLEYEWKYEDFDEEPLADDGTLSHAVERILEYVVKDAGYECKWVMTDRYAEKRLGHFQTTLFKAFERLQKSLGIRYISDLDEFEHKATELKKLCEHYKKIYIYGAGVFGVNCLHFMQHIDIKIDAFIVTDMSGNKTAIENIPVYSLNEIKFDNETFVIVAVRKEEYQKVIFENLKAKQLPVNAIYNWYSC